MSESIIIVDSNDIVLGYKPRDGVNYDEDIYRVSGLRITNPQGHILLAQRALTKKHDPGLRGPAVAGTNAEGETYETNISKEAKEELGLEDIFFLKGPKVFIDDGHKFWGQRFLALVDLSIKSFILQESEVLQVKWFTPLEVKQLFLQQPEIFIPSFKNPVAIFLS